MNHILIKISFSIFDSAYRNVPLSIVTDSNSIRSIDNTRLLTERATYFELNTRKPFKLNAGTVGVCVLFF